MVRAGFTKRLVKNPDHCSLFLVFGDAWSMQNALNFSNNKWIQGISKPDNPKCSLAFTWAQF